MVAEKKENETKKRPGLLVLNKSLVNSQTGDDMERELVLLLNTEG